MRASAILLGLCGGLALLEVGVRALALAPPLDWQYSTYVTDSTRLPRPSPLSRIAGSSPTGEFEYLYQHNRAGFRDVDHEPSKPAGTFRIVGLGDSFTYGVGVAFDETYLRRLEHALNERSEGHSTVEIIKAGIPRFFPEAERILLERDLFQYAPDLIVVGFVPNDLGDTVEGLDAVTTDASGFLLSRDGLGAWAVGPYRRSHLCRIVLRAFSRRRTSSRELNDRDIYRAGGAYEQAWRQIEAEYGRMSDDAAARGARLLIVHIPQGGHWSDARKYPATRLSQWAAAHHVEFVDTLPALQAAASSGLRLYYEKDGHPTPAGHAVIAQTVLDHLARNRLIP